MKMLKRILKFALLDCDLAIVSKVFSIITWIGSSSPNAQIRILFLLSPVQKNFLLYLPICAALTLTPCPKLVSPK